MFSFWLYNSIYGKKNKEIIGKIKYENKENKSQKRKALVYKNIGNMEEGIFLSKEKQKKCIIHLHKIINAVEKKVTGNFSLPLTISLLTPYKERNN